MLAAPRSVLCTIGVFLLGSMVPSLLSAADEAQVPSTCVYDRAEVYVGYWDEDYRSNQTIENVKKGYAFHVTIRDALLIPDLVRVLREQAQGLSCPRCVAGDVRMVVELSGGSCQTVYVGERARFGNPATEEWGRMTEEFKQRFSAFGLSRRGSHP